MQYPLNSADLAALARRWESIPLGKAGAAESQRQVIAALFDPESPAATALNFARACDYIQSADRRSRFLRALESMADRAPARRSLAFEAGGYHYHATPFPPEDPEIAVAVVVEKGGFPESRYVVHERRDGAHRCECGNFEFTDPGDSSHQCKHIIGLIDLVVFRPDPRPIRDTSAPDDYDRWADTAI